MDFKNLLGIEIGEGEWKVDILIGVGLVVVFVLLTLFAPSTFALGVPNQPLSSDTEDYFISTVIAPIGEELLFGGVILWGLSIVGMPFWLALIVVAGIFSGYHYWAYTAGKYLAVSSPFVGAFIFRLLASGASYARQNILTGIIFHAGVNLFIVGTQLVVVGTQTVMP